MKSNWWLAGVVVLVVTSACAQQQSAGEGVRVGEPAPTFELPSATGARVSLSDFKGQDVLLYFSMGPG
jgi:cytochrome oxidase Cu insertion factor (SCO1/SenC/PrrC family)